jgi:hypothetical protein
MEVFIHFYLIVNLNYRYMSKIYCYYYFLDFIIVVFFSFIVSFFIGGDLWGFIRVLLMVFGRLREVGLWLFLFIGFHRLFIFLEFYCFSNPFMSLYELLMYLFNLFDSIFRYNLFLYIFYIPTISSKG